ncbi:MAG: tRNA 2-selenouridine(34) synthase MnmH [Proteobacteria bacterium]|nr:tRNA 2-selenouridine(34) synthase MnmH [Pseudomonadota bacterium]
MELPEIDDFEALLCTDIPLLDVRAPVEFSQGAFPASYNAPLLDDAQRKQVGTCYKHEGHDAAVELGTRLISGAIKTARIARWKVFFSENTSGVLYCFRGGMRSKITQQWIFDETGVQIPRVKGGYKALRRYLIDQTESLAAQISPLILSGRTGSGKTHLLRQLKLAIDLEGLANHRGSSFGRQVSPQPTQINFENRVAIALLKLSRSGATHVVLEDESPNIGSVHIPHALYERMRQAPSVVLEATIERRIDITLKEYVVDMLPQYVDVLGSEEAGFAALSEYLRNSLMRVKRRLGGKGYTEILGLMDAALDDQAHSGSVDVHREWLRRMLTRYYDPMYDYQRDKRGRVVKKTGNFADVLGYLEEYQ